MDVALRDLSSGGQPTERRLAKRKTAVTNMACYVGFVNRVARVEAS